MRNERATRDITLLRFCRWTSFVGALLVSMSCGGSSTTSPTNDTIAGTWNLRTIDASSLPFVTFQSAGSKNEILSDVLVLTQSGSYTSTEVDRVTQGATVTTPSASVSGIYTVVGTAITLHPSSGAAVTGVISGTSLSVAGDGHTYVWRKQ